MTVPFGKAVVDQFERNYDQKSLEQLIQRFRILEFEIYEKGKNGWVISENQTNKLKKVACVIGIKN